MQDLDVDAGFRGIVGDGPFLVQDPLEHILDRLPR